MSSLMNSPISGQSGLSSAHLLLRILHILHAWRRLILVFGADIGVIAAAPPLPLLPLVALTLAALGLEVLLRLLL